MSKKESKPRIQLRKGALGLLEIGQSFAEYDPLLMKPGIFVTTPALNAAFNKSKSKCFFVGRRGTGKTAITFFIKQKLEKRAIQILPQIFAPLGEYLFQEITDLRDTRQPPFKSLVACFKRALQDEVVKEWAKNGLFSFNRRCPQYLQRERNFIEEYDFDNRVTTFIKEIFHALKTPGSKEWLRQINRPKELGKELEDLREGINWDYTLLIDRIDESWDGSDKAVVLLMALMHACVELSSTVTAIRPLLFLRENIFERVRNIDNEFSRLETSVVSVDWSKELLLEAVERRINLPLNPKLPLNGETWDYFFENLEDQSSRSFVFDYCQERPRDVLTFCSFAIESAQARKQEKVQIEDIQAARKRFSDSRLKDLGDEYSENYPQIQLILSRFYGLGREFTVLGVDAFIQKLLIDDEIKRHCSKWIYDYTTPDRFIYLLYGIGFWGIKDRENVKYRPLGPQSSSSPPLSNTSHVIIHPTYVEALNLQNVVVGNLDKSTPLRQTDMLLDLPEAINVDEYIDRLRSLKENLQTLPRGEKHAADYEVLMGEVIHLCFFRSLTNVEPKVRNHDGRVIRDWIASNRATSGFWQIVRQRYLATQIVWECKNYDNLDAGAFHQAAYYMTKEIGRFVVLSFRGEKKNHHYEHIKRVSSEKEGGVILLLTDQDIHTFLRQAINGKGREEHIQEIYDKTLREIS